MTPRTSHEIMCRALQLVLIPIKASYPVGGVGSLKHTIKGLKETIILIRNPIPTTNREWGAETMDRSHKQLELRTLHFVQRGEP